MQTAIRCGFLGENGWKAATVLEFTCMKFITGIRCRFQAHMDRSAYLVVSAIERASRNVGNSGVTVRNAATRKTLPKKAAGLMSAVAKTKRSTG